MATDILSIPQIDPSKIESLQNDLHIGFGGDTAKRLRKARWTDETHATKVFPDNVDTLIGDFLTAQATEDQVYVQSQGSDLTKRRLEKDNQRDVLYKEIRKTVDTFATLSIFPEKQQKALVMQPIMQKYNINPDGGIEAQTVATSIDPEASSLNYTYTELIKSIQETIKYYRQISDERRRANKRVTVKSDIVGNHTYATVAGWTWERLIQDGKAALDIDSDDATRIVSTDKKALKAGGLLLALAGVAVSPSDEVDAGKEYELIPIE